MNAKISIIPILNLTLVLVVVAQVAMRTAQGQPNGPTPLAATHDGEGYFGVDFTLQGAQGQEVRPSDFSDHYLLVAFGYTFCPDICPTTLYAWTRVMALLPQDIRTTVQPVFITIDPERDTPEVIANYVKYFDPSFIGLSGSRKQIEEAASVFHAYYAKVETDKYYTMDHSAYSYLVSPDQQVVDFFGFGEDPENVAKKITRAILEGKED